MHPCPQFSRMAGLAPRKCVRPFRVSSQFSFCHHHGDRGVIFFDSAFGDGMICFWRLAGKRFLNFSPLNLAFSTPPPLFFLWGGPPCLSTVFSQPLCLLYDTDGIPCHLAAALSPFGNGPEYTFVVFFFSPIRLPPPLFKGKVLDRCGFFWFPPH